jgi:8-oxo-dGTP pyrophosphatase MutT (NUDIX family)
MVVLAARRHSASGALLWMLPKGHLEADETAAEAARREVREETGIDAEVERPLGDVTYWYVRRDARGRPRRVLKQVRFFVMRHRGGRFGDRDDEMDAVRWFSLARAEERVARENERRLLRRARRLLEGDAGQKGRPAPRGRSA